MRHDVVLINGDSYTAANNMSCWADHIGDIIGAPVINIAVCGNNNDRIARSTADQVESLLQQHRRPLVLVGWSFVRRKEVVYHGDDQEMLGRFPRPNRFVTLDWLINQDLATPEQKHSLEPDFDVHKQLMDWYMNMFFLATYLRSHDVGYRFFSAANNTDCDIHCFPDLKDMNVVKNVCLDPCIYRLHGFCIPSWAAKHDPDASHTGHLSDAGTKNFAHWLCQTLEL